MAETAKSSLFVVCLATYFKGADFIRECKAHACRVVLVTKEKMLHEDWPRDSLDDLIAMPNDAPVELFIDLMAHLSKTAKIDRVVALEEFDVVNAALIREHLSLPGMSSSRAKTFRDKLAMAVYAKAGGINVPDFVPLLNPDEISSFLERVPGPWIIKPRSDVSAIGIRKVEQADEFWQIMNELNERQNLRERASYYILARFVAGEVFHVDSVVSQGKVLFAGVNQYGRPPMQVAHQGGAYISRTVFRGSKDERALLEENRKVIKALRLERGATHAEFIKSDADGKFYFLEIAARVGGAYIAEVLEAASGVNLWREWARMEIAPDEHPKIAAKKKDYAGVILSLAKQESPDTSSYTDPEIIYRVKKRHHAGMIVSSPSLERLTELLENYRTRFIDDFVAVVPPPERPE